MANRDFNVGDFVIIDRDNLQYDVGEDNPINTLGMVVGYDGWVYVQWCNGIQNAYKGDDSDLKSVEVSVNI